MNEPILTIVGNLTADPDIRFTTSGQACANFTVASTPRTYNRESNRWVDGETVFMRCTAWGNYAENIADSLRKGMQVIVNGRLRTQKWTDRETRQERTSLSLTVEDVGATLRFATAQITRASRSSEQSFQQPQQQQTWQPSQNQPSADSWGQPRLEERPPF